MQTSNKKKVKTLFWISDFSARKNKKEIFKNKLQKSFEFWRHILGCRRHFVSRGQQEEEGKKEEEAGNEEEAGDEELEQKEQQEEKEEDDNRDE